MPWKISLSCTYYCRSVFFYATDGVVGYILISNNDVFLICYTSVSTWVVLDLYLIDTNMWGDRRCTVPVYGWDIDASVYTWRVATGVGWDIPSTGCIADPFVAFMVSPSSVMDDAGVIVALRDMNV